MWKPLPILIACAALAAFPARAQPAAALKNECASCHALEKPAAPSVQRLWDRKGPDLWYAGDKFNRDWLAAWLQHPTTIRPGGVFWRAHAAPGDERHASFKAFGPLTKVSVSTGSLSSTRASVLGAVTAVSL